MRPLLALLLVSSVYELQAQIITFDHASRTYTPAQDNAVRQGSTVSYRIINVNTFAKKVVINGILFSLNTDVPTEISTSFRIQAGQADESLKNTQQQVDKMEAVKTDAAKLAKEATEKKAVEVPALTRAATEANELFEKCSTYYQEARKIKNALTIPKKIAETLADGTLYNETVMNDALKSRGIDAMSITALKTDLDKFNQRYYYVRRQYTETAVAAHDAQNDGNAAKVENAKEQVEKEYYALMGQYEGAINSIDSLVAKALNPHNYVVTSKQPIYVEDGADEVEFQIQIGDAAEEVSRLTPFKKILNVEGGLKLDYSVGFAFRLISDDQYFFDNEVLKKRPNGNILTPGIAPMVHLYRRTGHGPAWGGTFGVNADLKAITDVNLGFLAGASILFGQSQKAILSTGLSYSKVNRLKDGQFTTGSVYKNARIEDLTESVLRPSWFISLSLGIAKRKVIKP